jgi:hypothetical protein
MEYLECGVLRQVGIAPRAAGLEVLKGRPKAGFYPEIVLLRCCKVSPSGDCFSDLLNCRNKYHLLGWIGTHIGRPYWAIT